MGCQKNPSCYQIAKGITSGPTHFEHDLYLFASGADTEIGHMYA
jgi:hypothetical protein